MFIFIHLEGGFFKATNNFQLPVKAEFVAVIKV